MRDVAAALAWPALLFLLAAAASAQEPTVPDGPSEVVDHPPALIGGMAALSQAVVYPEAARQEGVEGRVIVQFVVDEAGGVRDAVAVRSPDDRLSEAAVDAVERMRFEPGRHRGQAVAVRFAVPVTFRLAPPEPPRLTSTVSVVDGGLPAVMAAVQLDVD